jgi:hypothetical protein
MKVTNNSKAIQGVWAKGGLVMIDPGQTRDVDIAADYLARARALPFLKVESADPLDHDGDGEKGGVADATPLTDAEKVELLDAMTDDELREFIAERDGKAPHPNAKRDTLLAKARGE